MALLRGMVTEFRGIVALAVPIVVGMSASMLLGVTDSLMLAPLGPVPLAAVGLTNAVAVIVFAAIYGLLSAVAVRVGHAHGAGAGRRIPGLIRNGLALGLAAGLVGAAVMAAIWPLLPLAGQPAEVLAVMGPYWAAVAAALLPFAMLTVLKTSFEAIGRPWLAAGLALFAVVVNVPLNWLLIWGAGPIPMLGLTGAGIATLAAEAAALAAALVFWARARSTRRLRLYRPLSAREILSAAREGGPLGAMYVAESGAIAVATMLVGTFGTVALAANQVAMSVSNVFYMVPLGIAGAVAIRMAQEQGAGRPDRLRPVAFSALLLATLWLTATALLLGLGGRAIAAAMLDVPAVIELAATMFFVFALMQVLDGVQSTMLGALRGMSDTAWPAAVSTFFYWGAGLPLAWALAVGLGLGPAYVWAAWILVQGATGLLLFLRFLQRTRAARLPGAGTGV